MVTKVRPAIKVLIIDPNGVCGQLFFVFNLYLHIHGYAALALFENDERVDVEVYDLRVNHEEP